MATTTIARDAEYRDDMAGIVVRVFDDGANTGCVAYEIAGGEMSGASFFKSPDDFKRTFTRVDAFGRTIGNESVGRAQGGESVLGLP